jgi:hypothetical protein
VAWKTALWSRLGSPSEVDPDGTDIWCFDAVDSDRAVFVQHKDDNVRVWQSGWRGIVVVSVEQLDALLRGMRVLVNGAEYAGNPGS